MTLHSPEQARTQRHNEAREIAALLADRVEDLAGDLADDRPVRIAHGELRIGEHGRFAVELRGAKRGVWCDHGTNVGGDPLDLIAHIIGTDTRGALRWALDWLAIAESAQVPGRPCRPVACPEPAREASGTVDLARRIWREAVPADTAGSLVPVYLESRGLALEPGAPLRFHPECPRGAERWPAMLALMTDPTTGVACGVHRTFLARDGERKAPGPLPAKMMAGRAGVVRLVADEDVTLGLGVAEGIETAVSVMQRFGWRPVWAATSAGGIRGFPVLAGVEAATIFADRDGAGLEAAEACARRWAEAGREARICAPPTGDFNDLASRIAA